MYQKRSSDLKKSCKLPCTHIQYLILRLNSASLPRCNFASWLFLVLSSRPFCQSCALSSFFLSRRHATQGGLEPPYFACCHASIGTKEATPCPLGHWVSAFPRERRPLSESKIEEYQVTGSLPPCPQECCMRLA